MDSSSLNTVLLAALLALIGWLGKRMTGQLDRMVYHLGVLNGRTEKLEARMTAEEKRNK